MKSFEIIIKDNETNEVLIQEEANAIIGAFSTEDGSASFTNIRCSILEIAATCDGVNKALEFVYKEKPMAKVLNTLNKEMGNIVKEGEINE